MHTLRIGFLLVLSFAPQMADAQLQWNNIGTFGPVQMIYFSDDLHGFVSRGTAPGGPHLTLQLFRTSNGGATWQEVVVDQFESGYGIQDMLMLSNGQGWACGGCDAGFSLWRTSDYGLTWKTVGAADHRFSVSIRMTKAGIIVSDFYKQHVRLSADGGSTFFDIFAPKSIDDLLGMDFSDSLHGVLVASFRTDNPWYYTTDGGIKWSPSDLSIQSWTVYSQKGTPNFFAVPEGYSNKPAVPSKCFRSTDYGKTWDTTFKFSAQMTGCVTGVNNVIYTQTVNPLGSNSGIYRSLDSGNAWTWLGGPNGFGETRFIARSVSCRKNVIYAAGRDNNLYKAYDSVGGEASQYTIAGLFAEKQLPAIIHAEDYADIELTVKFPSGSKAVGFVPNSVEYSLTFDARVAYPPPELGVVPPEGWIRKSTIIAGDSMKVTLEDSIGEAITTTQNFGAIDGFFALPPILHPGKNISNVRISKIMLRNECATIIAMLDTNNQLLRQIQILPNEGVVDEFLSGKKLLIYPNPVQSFLSFQLPKDMIIKRLIIFNTLGKMIWSANNQSGKIDVRSFAKGMYNFIVQSNGGFESASFIIN